MQYLPKRVAFSLAIMTALAGCGFRGEPQSQVVAQVGGEDITAWDLNAEALGLGGDGKAAEQAALRQLVDRTLLAQIAREQKLDQTKDYVLARHREQENALAELARDQIGDRVVPPGQAEVDRFVAANPMMFAQREIFVLDQIRFSRPSNPRDLDYLQPAATLSDVAEALGQNATRFERVPDMLDSATIPASLTRRLSALAPGAVFVIRRDTTMLASTIRERRPAPVPPAEAREQAARILLEQRRDKAVEQALDEMRRRAAITYQKGIAPPPASRAPQSPPAAVSRT